MNRGFTLLELIACLAIAAVLVLCAVPAFQAAQQRVRRSDAQLALLHLQLLQQRFLFDNGRYATALSELGDESTLSRSTMGHYDLELRTEANAEHWEVIATPAAESSQRDDRACTSLSLDASGRRTAAGHADASARCWA
jgi:type IV pilus assembly protein PilE